MRIHRRTALKWVHGAMIPLTVWFVVMTPADVVPMGLFPFHSVLALIYVALSVGWFADYLRRGFAGRPGPKLRGWQRHVHRGLHLALIWGLFGVGVTGFFLGLTADRQFMAGGIVPVAVPLDMPRAHEIWGTIHIWQFYLLGLTAVVHGGFHTWRHLRLHDNALRIMAPKALHRFL